MTILKAKPSLVQRVAARARRRLVVGATVMEVVVSMGVLGVGATGVVAMQKTTLIANMRARNLAVASNVASSWVGRLRSDANAWVRSPTGLSTLNTTKWLKLVLVAPDKWVRPDFDKLGQQSPMADVRGVDTLTTTNAAFCTNLRLTQVLPNLVRAEVRVFWLRNQGGGTLGGTTLCASDAGYLSNVGQATANYHFVYVTSAMIRNDTTG